MSGASLIIVLISIVLVSVILHEIVHGLVALHLGDDTAKLSGRLTLNPLSHIDPFSTVLLPLLLALSGLPPFGAAKPVPVNFNRLKYDEFGMAMVAVAGPLTNLLLAAVGGLMLQFGIQTGIGADIIALFVQVNISFFVFNMIPFPPLDGSRVLYALAPEPLQNFMGYIESLGLMAIVLFMVVIFPLVQPVMTQVVSMLSSLLTGGIL